MTVTSGRKCLELYRKSGPLGSLVRMCLESSIWRSTRCFLTWKIRATPANRLLFQLAASTPRTEETESSLWVGTPEAANANHNIRSDRFRSKTPNPVEFVQMWPTPRSQETGAYQYSQGRHDHPTLTLTGAARMWPTPTSRDYKDGSAESCKNVPVNGLLGRAIHFYPTPPRSSANGMGEHGSGGPNLQTVAGGQLNPTWVEWLMGFPIGWTDLNVSETP